MTPDWQPPERIEFDGLTIRRFVIEDANLFLCAVEESFESLRPWIPWAKERMTTEEAVQWCEKSVSGYEAHTEFTLGIWKGDEMVGGVGFYLRGAPIEDQVGEIGMWIHSKHAGQGLGTRVLKAFIDWGFDEWGWKKLNWICDTENRGSAQVAQKAGMILEYVDKGRWKGSDGEPKDAMIYVVTKAELSTP